METSDAVTSLSALAQASRLSIYRELVQIGPEGRSAGAIGAALGLPPATLSFHLAHLARAGLVQARQDGRFVIYSTDFAAMTDLIAYLTENCCDGASCSPAAALSIPLARKSDGKASRARRGR